MPAAKKSSPRGGIASRVLPIDRLDTGGIKFMIYGNSGTGKTRLMGSFGELGKLLHVVCSGNSTNEALSIRGMPNIDVIELRDVDELPEIVAYARGRYKTIGLDHVTEFCGNVLARVIGLKRLPAQLSWGLASQQDYQKMGLQSKEYLRCLVEFEGNSLFLGQQRAYDMVEDSEGSPLIPYVSIASTPAIAGWLAPTCDYIVQTFKKRKVTTVVKKIGDSKVEKQVVGPVGYFARTGPDETYVTKFRVAPGIELPEAIENPTYGKLSKLIL